MQEDTPRGEHVAHGPVRRGVGDAEGAGDGPQTVAGELEISARQSQGIDRRALRKLLTAHPPFVAQKTQIEVHIVADHNGTLQEVPEVRQQVRKHRRSGHHVVGDAVHRDHLRRHGLLGVHQ